MCSGEEEAGARTLTWRETLAHPLGSASGYSRQAACATERLGRGASRLILGGRHRQDPSEPGPRPATRRHPDVLPPRLTPAKARCAEQTKVTEGGELTVETGLHTPGPLTPQSGRAAAGA